MTLSHLASPRTPLRRLTAALMVIGALAIAAPLSASAATSGPPDERPITFDAAPADGGIVTAGLPVVVTVAAENPTSSTITAGEVRLTTSSTPLASRAEVTAWLAPADADGSASALPGAQIDLAAGELAGIAARGQGTLALTIDPAALTGWAPGVYPLRADYASDQGPLTATSVLVIPTEPGGGALGVVVPITGPALETGLLTADQLAVLTAPGGELRARLDAVTGTEVILAIDPAVVAAIRVLGTSAPAAARAWLDDLAALPNERFALQFGDADLAAQVAAGLDAPLQPTTLAPYLSAADFPATSATPIPTPQPTATGGASTTGLPTLAELTDVGATDATPFYWPASGTAGAEVVGALTAQTVDDMAPITLVASSATNGDTSAWASSGDARLLVYDADASAALGRAAASTDALPRAGALAAASAYAALATTGAPDAPLLVAVDRGTAGSAAALRATITAATGLSGRGAVPLSAITAGEPATVTLASVTADAEPAATLSTLLEDEAGLAAFATILTPPSLLTGPERAAILQLIGNAWRTRAGAWTDAVATHRTQTQATIDSVGVVPPSDITLATSSAPLTFSVRNDLPWPVSLVLITTPGDPRLIVQNTTPVEAGASQNTRVSVPVEARVGSGESTIRLQLRSPSMVAVGPSVPVHVAVRAEWESVGIAVMIVLVAGMIVAGTVRTIRRMRGRRKDERADADADG